MKSILDSSFHYTPSICTDLKKTFAKIRRQQRDRQIAETVREVKPKASVLSLSQRKAVVATH